MSDPTSYNESQLASGQIKASDLTEMARLWQHVHDLKPDGALGPLTLADVREGKEPVKTRTLVIVQLAPGVIKVEGDDE